MDKGEKSMREKMDKALIGLEYWLNEKFLKEEDGDSTMVAVIVLIVIILAVAVVFREQLMNAVNSVFERFAEFVG